MSDHARLSASGAYRWFACPGSPRLIDTVPPAVQSEYAAEGTKAHDLAVKMLTKQPWCLSDYDEEMFDAVQEYVMLCQKYLVQGAAHWIERKFDLSPVYPDCFGTADFVCHWPQHKKLIVIDYKHGSGIWIDPRNNPQLLYYGLGAVLDLNLPNVETIELGICQPRCGDGQYRSVDISLMDLLDFRTELVEYAKKTEDPNAHLIPGDHCRFCPASAVCPELRAQSQAVAKIEFAPQSVPSLDDLALCLASRETVKAWLKGLDEFAYAWLASGKELPGWKLVEKRPLRKWKDEEAAARHLIAAGYSVNDIQVPRDLKSPAQIEKWNKTAYGVVANFVEKVSSGNTIAPESDERPAVKRITAQEEFAPEVIDVFS